MPGPAGCLGACAFATLLFLASPGACAASCTWAALPAGHGLDMDPSRQASAADEPACQAQCDADAACTGVAWHQTLGLCTRATCSLACPPPAAGTNGWALLACVRSGGGGGNGTADADECLVARNARVCHASGQTCHDGNPRTPDDWECRCPPPARGGAVAGAAGCFWEGACATFHAVCTAAGQGCRSLTGGRWECFCVAPAVGAPRASGAAATCVVDECDTAAGVYHDAALACGNGTECRDERPSLASLGDAACLAPLPLATVAPVVPEDGSDDGLPDWVGFVAVGAGALLLVVGVICCVVQRRARDAAAEECRKLGAAAGDEGGAGDGAGSAAAGGSALENGYAAEEGSDPLLMGAVGVGAADGGLGPSPPPRPVADAVPIAAAPSREDPLHPTSVHVQNAYAASVSQSPNPLFPAPEGTVPPPTLSGRPDAERAQGGGV